ncbi:hypothetical protein [uncultured Shimia sp.]|uniref:hypothetical protein n=1 Tax=uncultured Shimia sp. TaxID=573152 RepID=UPI00263A1CAA|nr:hypothetical protein [uncultured Shimia sp.]
MRPFSALVLALVMSCPLALPASAQSETPTSTRQVYTQARAELDMLIMQRRMGDAIRMFDQVIEIDEAELAALDAQMLELFEQDFGNVGLVRSVVHKNGFRQEMIAYWTGRDYLYLYLLLHTDKSTIRLLNFQFDTDFHALNDLF